MEKEKKPFKTFDEQIEYLESLNLIINDRSEAKDLLKRCNYYMLINNYDAPFLSNSYERPYLPKTSLKMIYEFYNFDIKLKELFLRNLFKVEKHIKTLVAYYFSKMHGSSENFYLAYENYYDSTIIDRLTNRLQSETCSEYKKQNGHIPLWVFINELTFGEVVEMYASLGRNVQNAIVTEFKCFDSEQLESILRLLVDCRNVCAHNKPVYSYNYHNELPRLEAYNIIGKYSKTNSSIVDIIVSFKYLLSKSDYTSFYINLVTYLESLEIELKVKNPESSLNINKFYEHILKSMNLWNLDIEALLDYRPEELSYFKGRSAD